ncbi:MAG: KamA family radical SAM protein [Sulfurospirillaceae bacterium]|nr:KamA family radical SAM protein [Sulfurospirillaceae bacterium]
MECAVSNEDLEKLDKFDIKLFELLYEPSNDKKEVSQKDIDEVKEWLEISKTSQKLTNPMVQLFNKLKTIREKFGATPEDIGIDKDELYLMAMKHKNTDEHRVSVGGRVYSALPIVEKANARVKDYLDNNKDDAPSGFDLHEQMLENRRKIQKKLGMTDEVWDSYAGQIKYAITSPEQLASIIDIPQKLIEDIQRVSKVFRMRISPYYASLIMPNQINDPILLQSVPTGDMVDNNGIELEPVASDHSPARLIDQFYPRVLTIKATNMCAMFCTHCLRIAHISDKDWVSSNNTYEEALNYIRNDENIRDVLITGGDALALSNKKIEYLLNELDKIPHVKIKRLGSRIPIMTPQRIDDKFLEICEKSNDIKPLRFVTQINSAQELTPESHEAFRKLSKVTSAILNQAVFLRGINDTRNKMWKLCEALQESYIRPYYLFNCSFRNPEFAHMRVPVSVGRDIVESMYGNISGDAIPRYLATAGGKIPLHRDNVVHAENGNLKLKKPWSGEEVDYPDMTMEEYNQPFAFEKYR